MKKILAGVVGTLTLAGIAGCNLNDDQQVIASNLASTAKVVPAVPVAAPAEPVVVELVDPAQEALVEYARDMRAFIMTRESDWAGGAGCPKANQHLANWREPLTAAAPAELAGIVSEYFAYQSRVQCGQMGPEYEARMANRNELMNQLRAILGLKQLNYNQ